MWQVFQAYSFTGRIKYFWISLLLVFKLFSLTTELCVCLKFNQIMNSSQSNQRSSICDGHWQKVSDFKYFPVSLSFKLRWRSILPTLWIKAVSQRSGLNSDNFYNFFLNQALYMCSLYTIKLLLFFICICCQPDRSKWC